MSPVRAQRAPAQSMRQTGESNPPGWVGNAQNTLPVRVGNERTNQAVCARERRRKGQANLSTPFAGVLRAILR